MSKNRMNKRFRVSYNLLNDILYILPVTFAYNREDNIKNAHTRTHIMHYLGKNKYGQSLSNSILR